jgi:molecular chaperone DnaK (HSP70)
MSLNLDGILEVSATEKCTGKSKHITITNALTPRADEELAAAQERIRRLYADRGEDLDQMFDTAVAASSAESEPDVVDGRYVPVDSSAADDEPPDEPPAEAARGQDPAVEEARNLLLRSRKHLNDVHEEDKEEMIDLHEQIEQAIERGDADALSAATEELKELLFFLEGK